MWNWRRDIRIFFSFSSKRRTRLSVLLSLSGTNLASGMLKLYVEDVQKAPVHEGQ